MSSKRLARSTGQSVKEGMTFLALLGSFLTDILTPLGAFSGGLAVAGFVALLFSGSLWAMRRFPDLTADGHIAHSKWAVLVSGGVTLICGALYLGQSYAADVRSSQLGLLANYLPVVEDMQKKLTPQAHARALDAIRRELSATREAAERAASAASEASTQAAGAQRYARLAYQEVAYTNTPAKLQAMLQEAAAPPGVAAQLVRKYPFENEISGAAALDVLDAFPSEYRRDLIEPLAQSIAPGARAEAYLAFLRPPASGQRATEITGLLNPKVTDRFDWAATKGFWRDCFAQFSVEVCQWKAFAMHPAFEPLQGAMFVHVAKQFLAHGGTGNVMLQLIARGATTDGLAPEHERAVRRSLHETAEEHPERRLQSARNVIP